MATRRCGQSQTPHKELWIMKRDEETQGEGASEWRWAGYMWAERGGLNGRKVKKCVSQCGQERALPLWNEMQTPGAKHLILEKRLNEGVPGMYSLYHWHSGGGGGAAGQTSLFRDSTPAVGGRPAVSRQRGFLIARRRSRRTSLCHNGRRCSRLQSTASVAVPLANSITGMIHPSIMITVSFSRVIQ